MRRTHGYNPKLQNKGENQHRRNGGRGGRAEYEELMRGGGRRKRSSEMGREELPGDWNIAEERSTVSGRENVCWGGKKERFAMVTKRGGKERGGSCFFFPEERIRLIPRSGRGVEGPDEKEARLRHRRGKEES